MADTKPFPTLAKLGFVLMIFGGFWVQDSLRTQKKIEWNNLDPNATYALEATEKRLNMKQLIKLEKLGYGFLVGGLALIVFAFRKDKILKGMKHPTRF